MFIYSNTSIWPYSVHRSVQGDVQASLKAEYGGVRLIVESTYALIILCYHEEIDNYISSTQGHTGERT